MHAFYIYNSSSEIKTSLCAEKNLVYSKKKTHTHTNPIHMIRINSFPFNDQDRLEVNWVNNQKKKRVKNPFKKRTKKRKRESETEVRKWEQRDSYQ